MSAKLTKNDMNALDEVETYSVSGASPFWWRKASMQKLAALGYVQETWQDNWGPEPKGRKPFIITDAGRVALAEARP